MNRRLFIALLLGSATGSVRLFAGETGDEVSVAASRFEFTPDKVSARVGQPITLVLTSLDRIHGFKMPEFGIRTDIVPDRETRVTLVPTTAGTFTFFCDVFCGDGHEEMAGTLVVT